jgi:type I restriction enzyme R subunit
MIILESFCMSALCAKLRNLLRLALRKWKYPPDRADEAIELCPKQAEALSQSWSS